VDNAAHHEGGVEKLYLNGVEIPVGVIADDKLTDGAEIKVVM